MKEKMLFIFCFGFLSLFSQKTIVEVDSAVQRIKDNLGSFEKKDKINTDSTRKTFYFDKEELRLIAVEEKMNISKQVEWYFLNEALLYTETRWLNRGGDRLLFSEKTYHHNGRLIAWLNSENTFVDSNSPGFKKLDTDLFNYSRKIKDGAEED